MKNIFEGAKFGDKFLTRGGSIAILTVPKTHQVMLEDLTEYLVMSDGLADDDMPSYDIVSRYQEPIDEEKLDELAYERGNKESTIWWEEAMNRWKSLPLDEQKKYHQLIGFNDFSDILLNKIAEAYKAGYRKAIEE